MKKLFSLIVAIAALSRAEAVKKVAAAEGEAQALLTRSKAEADANNMLNESLKPNVLEKMRLDNQHYAIFQWKGQVPNTMMGSNGTPSGIIMNLK